jgi:hypothetical protein
MTYGLAWKTNSGTLAIHSDGYGVAYIGTATYVGNYNPGGYQTILSSYTINSTFAPMVFFELITGVISAVVSVVQTSTGVWTIIISSCTTATQLTVAPSAPTIQTPTLYCFAQLSGSGTGGYGLRMFDAAGHRSWDSTANMIIPRSILTWGNQAQTNTGTLAEQTISFPSGLSRPAHFAMGRGWGQSTIRTGSSSSLTYSWTAGFAYVSGTSLKRSLVQTQIDGGDTSAVSLHTIYKAEAGIIIDLADYI